MNGSRDARDRLRGANPVRVEDAPNVETPQALALFERIVATDPVLPPPRVRRPWFRWRRLWVLVPVAVLASAASFGYLHRAKEPYVVACYPKADLSSPLAAVAPSVDGPLAACSELWQPGGQFNPAGDEAVPMLTACILKTGALAVFPGQQGVDTCGDLGLVRADDSVKPNDEERKVIRATEAVSAEFSSRCIGRDEAVSFAEQQLTKQGLDDWKVRASTPFAPGRPCATLFVDAPNQTFVVVVPTTDPA